MLQHKSEEKSVQIEKNERSLSFSREQGQIDVDLYESLQAAGSL